MAGIVAPLVAVPLFDFLMLLLAVPLLKNSVNDRLPEKLQSLMPAYRATRILAESLFEALPQTCIQIHIFFETGNQDPRLFVFSIAVSILNLILVLSENYFAMRKMGLGVREYVLHLVEIGGGEVTNMIADMLQNEVKELDLETKGINDAQAKIIGENLKSNASLTKLW